MMAIDTALVLAFSATAFTFFYLAYAGRDNRVFRIFFMLIGFSAMYVEFAVLAAFTQGFTIPASTQLTDTYYSAASIASLTPLMYAFQFVIEIATFLYLAIEIILYIMYWLDMRKLKKQKAKNEYPEYGMKP